MRRLLVITGIIVAILGTILGVAWTTGESRIVRELRPALTQSHGVSARDLSELRDPLRFGVRLDSVMVNLADLVIELPMLDIWLQMLRPNEVHASLPERLTIQTAAGPLEAWLDAPEVNMRFALLDDLAIRRGRIAAQQITLQGRQLASGLDLTGRLVHPGPDAPPSALSTYEIRGGIAAFDIAVLPGVILPPGMQQGQVSVSGEILLWLDGHLVPMTEGHPPRLLGLDIETLHLSLGDMQVELAGQIVADSLGRAEGQIMLYTRDTEQILQIIANLGMIPKNSVLIGTGFLEQVSKTHAPAPSDHSPSFRTRRDGELRLPLIFTDGAMKLGPLRIGNAPVLSAQP